MPVSHEVQVLIFLSLYITNVVSILAIVVYAVILFTAMQCPPLEDSATSYTLYSTNEWFVGDRVTYICQDSLIINGTTEMQSVLLECLPNRTWREKPPLCVGRCYMSLVQNRVFVFQLGYEL